MYARYDTLQYDILYHPHVCRALQGYIGCVVAVACLHPDVQGHPLAQRNVSVI